MSPRPQDIDPIRLKCGITFYQGQAAGLDQGVRVLDISDYRVSWGEARTPTSPRLRITTNPTILAVIAPGTPTSPQCPLPPCWGSFLTRKLPLTETTGIVIDVRGPIGGDDALADEPMDARMRPIGGFGYVSVFDRIVMDVIHVAAVIVFVANPMLPEPALPDAAFAFAFAAS